LLLALRRLHLRLLLLALLCLLGLLLLTRHPLHLRLLLLTLLSFLSLLALRPLRLLLLQTLLRFLSLRLLPTRVALLIELRLLPLNLPSLTRRQQGVARLLTGAARLHPVRRVGHTVLAPSLILL
jgi:hypothetical protein